jgi:hypothetical protein
MRSYYKVKYTLFIPLNIIIFQCDLRAHNALFPSWLTLRNSAMKCHCTISLLKKAQENSIQLGLLKYLGMLPLRSNEALEMAVHEWSRMRESELYRY